MRIKIYGIDKTDKKHFIAEIDDWNLKKFSFETDCVDAEMRPFSHFKEIQIETVERNQE